MNTLIFLNQEVVFKSEIGGSLAIYLAVIFLLIVISAMMSGSESAFFTLGPKELDNLKEEDNSNSRLILKLLENPRDLLATILITNNMVNVGVVILSSFVLNEIFPLNSNSNEIVRFLLDVIGITFLILLTGEVLPKIYANKHALSVAKLTSKPLYYLGKIPPISWIKYFLVNGGSFINKLNKASTVKITSDDLEQALALTKEENSSLEEQKLLEGIVKFGNTETSQIMRSRIEISAIDEKINLEELIRCILDYGYSRIPVYRESLDNVIGILYSKDLLPHLNEKEDFEWKKVIRKPYFVPENKKIDDLLKEFQQMKMHMAIVVDEYGGASGLITLEDILEEIVGDITDEFDETELVYTKVDANTYVFEGRTALVDFYKVTDVSSKEFESTKGESDTLGGFIIEQAGRILRNNEYIICDDVKLIVESSDKRRIKMIKCILPEMLKENH
ncbi:MAG: gliding motility-associated protein GldE [Bacteroidetes bacterium]|nr:gliding motility-associated protein GldE [Bacteroidota bacterium]